MNAQVILIVDDEDDVIQALRFRLETAGYKVLTAPDGQQALEYLQTNRVDLILTDLMMPEVNGLELARQIQSDPALSGAKIVLFSCHTEAEVQAQARRAGVLDCLPKTQGAGAIVRRIYTILNATEDAAPKALSAGTTADASAAEHLPSSKETGPSPRRTLAAGEASELATGPSEDEGLDTDLRRLASSIASFGHRTPKLPHQSRP